MREDGERERLVEGLRRVGNKQAKEGNVTRRLYVLHVITNKVDEFDGFLLQACEQY